MKVLGSVCRVVYASPSGGAIFRLNQGGSHKSIRVVATYQIMPSPPVLGECWELTGDFRTDASFGRQFYATTAVRRIPTDEAIVDLIGRHPAFPGMGRALAQRLWRKLGAHLEQTLNAGKVCELVAAGIPSSLAFRLIQDWLRYSLETNVLEFFQHYGYPLESARTAIHFWGSRTIDLVKENPYRLVPFTAWQKVDRPALLGLKIPFNSEIRLVAACEAVCNDKLNRYEFAVEMKEFESRLAEKIEDRSLTKRAIEVAVSREAIIIRASEKLEIVQGRGAYLIERGIQSLITGEVLNERDKVRQHLPLVHNIPQSQLDFPKYHIVPLPTWANRHFWELFATQLLDALHILPTPGLKEALSLPEEAETVLLGDVMSGRIRLHTEGRTVFIHEAASLDILAANIVLRSLRGPSRIYLVGDVYQPFPSGPGVFFHSLVNSDSVMQLDIGEQYYSSNSPSQRIADALCTGAAMKVATEDDQIPHILSITVTSTRDRHAANLAAYREHSELGSAVIVGKTWRACRIMNQELHNELVDYCKATEGVSASLRLRWNEDVVVGDVITCHSNDYRRGLMVGSRGVVVDIFLTPQLRESEDGNRTVVVASANIDTAGLIELTADDCRSFSLGYAIPVSYALLSRWETVIACIERSRLVDKNWIYAATSRATRRVIVIGQPGDIESALQLSRPAATRLTGLPFDALNACPRF